MVSLDFRTRTDDDIRDVDTRDFFVHDLPELIAAHAHFAVAGAADLVFLTCPDDVHHSGEPGTETVSREIAVQVAARVVQPRGAERAAVGNRCVALDAVVNTAVDQKRPAVYDSATTVGVAVEECDGA